MQGVIGIEMHAQLCVSCVTHVAARRRLFSVPNILPTLLSRSISSARGSPILLYTHSAFSDCCKSYYSIYITLRCYSWRQKFVITLAACALCSLSRLSRKLYEYESWLETTVVERLSTIKSKINVHLTNIYTFKARLLDAWNFLVRFF